MVISYQFKFFKYQNMKSKELSVARRKIKSSLKKSLLPELLLMIVISLLIVGLIFLIAL